MEVVPSVRQREDRQYQDVEAIPSVYVSHPFRSPEAVGGWRVVGREAWGPCKPCYSGIRSREDVFEMIQLLNRYKPVLLVVIVTLVGIRLYSSNSDPATVPSRNAVIKPVDGDTFWYDGKKVRVMDIDTPEPSKYGNAECSAEAKLGDKASEFTKDIITTREIKIEWSGREDRYGRALARVRVGDRYLGDMLTNAGLAKPWRGRQVDWCAIL